MAYGPVALLQPPLELEVELLKGICVEDRFLFRLGWLLHRHVRGLLVVFLDRLGHSDGIQDLVITIVDLLEVGLAKRELVLASVASYSHSYI